ncbi:unnamed protein product [Didymodactylos carnosus]|uniref:Uncharacterized protein n=1 Tax=Didymodactylos carnosus TaxID=1234261 RepID=A0A815FHW8_9BILA|nr:unnamed protein product [Didymodactylos carnosus]CAF1323740.1 unnamed protein product [Didymodactylos carnosus]CAF4075857.1 unnamed protein product [Didymodactylos carnosus]CAF4171809.1 unnamed protein product [Didymodactylos carnosus]
MFVVKLALSDISEIYGWGAMDPEENPSIHSDTSDGNVFNIIGLFNPNFDINIAESYRFAVNGLFKNNLIENVTTQQTMDYEGNDKKHIIDEDVLRVHIGSDNIKVSPKAKDYNRIYLVLDSFSDSIVGVNVFEFYAINQGLPADITIE